MINNNQYATVVNHPIAAFFFYTLSILLLPVSLLGYIIWLANMYLAGGGSGVSRTAQGPLSARWTMHHLGTRRDEAAARLGRVRRCPCRLTFPCFLPSPK